MVQQFFNAVGLSSVPPATFGEFIPYFITLVVGIGLIAWAMNLIRYWIVHIFGSGGRLL